MCFATGTVWLAIGIVALIVGVLFTIPAVVVCRRLVRSMVEEEVCGIAPLSKTTVHRCPAVPLYRCTAVQLSRWLMPPLCSLTRRVWRILGSHPPTW